MGEPKYKAPNGQIVTESELKAKYGERFFALVQDKTFAPVTENVYKAPNGKFEAESVLKQKYGEKFTELTANGTFALDISDPVKKKAPSDYTSATQKESTVSEPKTGSSGTRAQKVAPPSKAPAVEGTMEWNHQKLLENQPGYTSLYDNLQKKGQVAPERVKEIQQEVEDEANNEGIWNNIKTAGRTALDFASKALTTPGLPQHGLAMAAATTNSDALKNQKAKAREIIAKSTGADPKSISENDVLAKAKELRLAERLKSERETQIKPLLKQYQDHEDKFGVSDKDKLTRFQVGNLKTIREDEKLALTKQNVLRSEVDAYAARLEKMNAQAKEIKDSNKPVTQEFIAQFSKEYDDLAKKHDALLGETLKAHDEFVDATENLGSAEDNLDLFKRDYGWIKNKTGRLDATISGIVAGGAGAVDYGLFAKSVLLDKVGISQGKLGEAVDLSIRNIAKRESDYLYKDAEKTRNEIRRNISTDGINNLSDFGEWFGNTVIEQVPIYGMIATGAPGVAGIGAYSAGEKYEEMQREMHPENPQPGQLIPNYSDTEQVWAPAGYIVAETASALVDLMILKSAGRVWKSATAAERREMASGAARAFLKSAGKAAGSAVKGGVAEGVDEGTTQFFENKIDIAIGKKQRGQELDGIQDASAAGAILGAMIPGLSNIAADIMKPLSTDSRIQKSAAKTMAMQAELDKGNLSEDAKSLLESQLKDQKKKTEGLLKKQVKKIGAMSDEQFQEVLKASTTQANIKAQAQAIKADETLSEDMKKQLLANLKEEFRATEDRRIDLIERGANKYLAGKTDEEVTRLKDKASRELMKEKNPDGTKNVTIGDAEISQRAGEIVIRENREKLKKEKEKQEKESAANTEPAPVSTEPESVSTEAVAPLSEEFLRLDTETPTQSNTENEIPFENEGKESGTAPVDGNVPFGDTVVEQNGTPVEQSAAKENLPEPAVSESGKSVDAGKSYQLTPNGPAYTVRHEGGRLEITDQNGNEPSAPTRRAIEAKWAENFDFTQGERAPAVEFWEYTDEHIAKNSENPAELAEIILNFDRQASAESGVSYTDQIIAENLGKVKAKGYTRFGDRNKVTPDMRKTYFDENGRDIDELAQEMSEIAGVEITPQDLTEFMERHPKGFAESVKEGQQKAEQANKVTIGNARAKFEKLTGLPASDKNLLKAAEQQARILGLGERISSLDVATGEQLQELAQLAEESEKALYGTQRQNESGTKNAGQAENSQGNEGKSGVREDGKGKTRAKPDAKPDAKSDAKSEKIAAAEAKIDDIAAYIKDLFPKADIDPAQYKTQGFTQDALIDLVAKAAKAIVATGIEVNEALRQVMDAIKANYSIEVDEKAVKSRIELDGKKAELVTVYHGGHVKNLSDTWDDVPMYVSQDKSQAGEYAKGHDGKVRKFVLDKSKVADEDAAREIIAELGLEPQNGEDRSEWLNLYELIDPNFDTALSDEDITKLFDRMKQMGFEGIEFTDMNLRSLRNDIDNIVVFDPRKSLQTKKDFKAEKANLKVDEIAAWLKGVLPKADINPEDYKSQGFSQDQLIDLIANTVKNLVKAGIEMEAAIADVVEKIKHKFNVEVDLDDVRDKISGAQSETLEQMASYIPNKGRVKQYLSGETIDKYENESPNNDQNYVVQELEEALKHGIGIVEAAKRKFGKDYVEKTLEMLEGKIDIPSKALIYVSLENDLAARKLADPDNQLQIQKLQDLVREKSQAFLRQNSIALNMGRLRAFAKAGYDINAVTDKFFSSEQREGRRKLEKAIQANADAINNEAEAQDEDVIAEAVAEGVQKQIDDIYAKLPTQRRQKADKAIAALEKIQKNLRSRAYDASVGVPVAVIDAGITVIKNAIKAGVNIADAVELGIGKIKELHKQPWGKENEFRKDMLDGFNAHGINSKQKSSRNSKPATVSKTNYKEIVRQALIDKGFSREITVTRKSTDADGNTVKTKEKKSILDWKKLAGEEGSIDKMRSNVEEALKDKGYSAGEVDAMKAELENEYHNLRADIIEKAMNELDRRNTPKKPADRKSAARKLAELYNFGLFEKEAQTYDHLMNSALGMNELEHKYFVNAKELAQALSELYSSKTINGEPISEFGLRHAARMINKQIEILLTHVAWSQSNGAYKAATIVKEYLGLSQRFMLNSVKQAIENPVSGTIQRTMTKIGFGFSKTDTKSLRKMRGQVARNVYIDNVKYGGLDYGDVSTALVSKSKTEDWLNGLSPSRIYHNLLSDFMGRAYLESADSMHKAALTERYFSYNLIKILTDRNNPSRMSKEDAVNFVSEHLTGQSFEDALKTAQQIIDKANKDAGKKVLPDHNAAVHRLAQDIVKDALLQGKKITIEEIEASYKAAYKAAGFDLGHEANNVISVGVSHLTSFTESKIQQAIKDKKWNEAAAFTLTSIVTRHILNPFVGGGTNWVVLTLQKSGVDLISPLVNYARARDNRLDLTTEKGMKNIEKALVENLKSKATNTRLIVGGMAGFLLAAAAVASGEDDDMRAWLKKNDWARKYFNVLAPQAIIALLAYEDGEMARYFSQILNLRTGTLDEGTKMVGAVKNLTADTEKKQKKGMGTLGDLIGSRLSAPLPFRFVRDVEDIVRGISGGEKRKVDFQSSGFWNGYFKGGVLEYLDMRPEKDTGEDDKSLPAGNSSSRRNAPAHRPPSHRPPQRRPPTRR